MRVIRSGGQRLQPETRLLAQKVFGAATVQENFGMAEGLLMFVRLDDPEVVRLETVGRPICPDDEVRLVDDDGVDVPVGEVGELWARGSVHTAWLFQRRGAQRPRLLSGRLPHER